MEQYVGLDVSLEETSVCVVEKSGEVIWEGKVATAPEVIAAVIRGRAPSAARIGLETGPLSTALWHGLRARGLAVICIDARHAKGVLSLRVNKTDRNDALGLAQLMLSGWYREVSVKSLESHETRALLGGRALLVKVRVELENQVRGLCRNLGLMMGPARGGAFGRRVADAVAARPALAQVIEPLLSAWRAVCRELAVLDRQVMAQAKDSPVCRLLMTVPGVGALTALAFMAAVDDPGRFRRSSSVGAYLGLTPRRYQSGEVDHAGHISKCGDRLMRTYLFEAAGVLLTRVGRWCALKAWGLRLAKRVGLKKAKVAVARRLAVLLHAMWRDASPFRWSKAEATA
jgi:transposase